MTKKKTTAKATGASTEQSEKKAPTASKKVTKKKTSKKTTKKVDTKATKTTKKTAKKATKKVATKTAKTTAKKATKKTAKKTTKKVAQKAESTQKVAKTEPTKASKKKTSKKTSKKVTSKVEKTVADKAPAPKQISEMTIEERIAEKERLRNENRAQKSNNPRPTVQKKAEPRKPEAKKPEPTKTEQKAPEVKAKPEIKRETKSSTKSGLAPLPGEKISGGLLALEQQAAKKNPERKIERKPEPAPAVKEEKKVEAPKQEVATSKPAASDTTNSGNTTDDNGEEKPLSRSARRRRNYRNNKRKRLEQERAAENGGEIKTEENATTNTSQEKVQVVKTAIEPITASAILAEKEKEKKLHPARKETGRNMLMNVVDHGELRVAIAGKKGLEEIYIEKSGGEFVHGNIFKGVVENVEPNLQAAFVNIGAEKNGFLHVRDVIYPFGGFEEILGKPNRQRPTTKRPPINQMLQKGQEILVQITREQVATKGPSLTTYISLPGRYLVLMPAVKKRGVSRKITNKAERDELRKALEQLDPPNDMGYIIRTAGMGKGKDELQRDLDYLTMLWEAIANHTQNVKGPMPIYQESDLVIRAIRDYFTDNIDTMYIDSEEEYKRAQEFLKLTMPEDIKRAKYYGGSEPLFSRYDVEDEINGLFNKSVRLKSGGELIIEQTEAMVTIDVNTGRYLKGKSSSDMVLKINKEAALEIAKQLRLRDMGGLVMIDFIDMEAEDDRKNVENTFRSAMQVDRAKTTILPISSLGVMEMTRQRMRQSLNLSHFDACKHCGGTGVVKNIATLETEFMRGLRSNLVEGKDCKIKMNPDTAIAISNKSRLALTALEEEYRNNIIIISDSTLRPDKFVINK